MKSLCRTSSVGKTAPPAEFSALFWLIVSGANVIKRYLRKLIRSNPVSDHILSLLWSRRLHAKYRREREKYQEICQERGLNYNEVQSIADIRARLAKRGYTAKQKQVGGVHTYIVVPSVEWHPHLLDDLHQLGPVTQFDHVARGFPIEGFMQADAKALADRRAMNDMVLQHVRATHRERPIDWIFSYVTGTQLACSTIRAIQDELGIPVVNMCLDDKQSWQGPWMGDHYGGQIDTAKDYDLTWTSARVACEWYLAEGGRPIYMPEGCNLAAYRPMNISPDIDVSFVGVSYGFRAAKVRKLRQHGIQVEAFGPGWPNGAVWGDDAVHVMNRSRINLGMGGIHNSEWLTNVKTRDFEVPACGAGLYITSYNCDLALHFEIGREIVCYRTDDEMIELIRHYLSHQEEAAEIARRGRERCIREHRWLHRYVKLCGILGIVQNDKLPSHIQ